MIAGDVGDGEQSYKLLQNGVLVLLSLTAGYMTFRTGDLGAKAVWQGRLQAGRPGSGRFP